VHDVLRAHYGKGGIVRSLETSDRCEAGP